LPIENKELMLNSNRRQQNGVNLNEHKYIRNNNIGCSCFRLLLKVGQRPAKSQIVKAGIAFCFARHI
jgi:hypothetical protein